MKTLHIVRGLPGSGKSTFAMTLGCNVFEADMFFIKDGVYQFNPSQIKDAHQWCQSSVESNLKAGFDTAVSNTFTQNWEIQPYFHLAGMYGAKIKITKCVGKWENIHGVPPEAIQRMSDRWEDVVGEEVYHGN